MLQTYFKTAIRFLKKNRFYTVINILGLALGMATFLLISLWVFEELSYDRFHHHTDRIYRIKSELNAGQDYFPYAFLPVGELVDAQLPEVGAFVRIQKDKNPLIEGGENKFYEKDFLFVDTNFFDFFNFKLIRGNPENVLTDMHSVVITESMAGKYFKGQDPINQTLILNNTHELKVTGVVQNPPANSHIQFDFIAPLLLNNAKIQVDNIAWNRIAYTYLLLQPGVNIPDFTEKLSALVHEHSQVAYSDNKFKMALSPLLKVHLWDTSQYDLSPSGNIYYVYLLSAIALLVLVIACINYINMATAQGAKRTMEVGLRKTVGASSRQVFSQFIVEAFCLVAIALLLSLIITKIALPFYNNLTDKTLTLPLSQPLFWAGLFGIVLVVSFLSGSYPAIFLSRFLPVSIFQKSNVSQSGISLRRVLVVFQFFVSYALIMATLILKSQLTYLQTVNMGFEKENTIVLPVDGKVSQQFTAFKNQLLQQPEIMDVASSSSIPSQRNMMIQFMDKIEGIENPKENPVLYADMVDQDFFPVLRMKLLAGRNFSETYATDTTEAVIINETAARDIGWYTGDSLSAIGKYMIPDPERPKLRVIGVVKDFNFQSLKTKIEPTIFHFMSPGQSAKQAEDVRFVSVKITGHDLPGTIKKLEETWKAFISDIPFQYSFLDDDFDQLYKKEEKMTATFTSFSLIAIGLSFLGIIGLTTFVTLQRTKEIGIRKVLGASVSSILMLLSKDYVKLLLIAFVAAIPIANYFMSEWLKEFAYKIEIHWWMFALPGTLVVLIALLSVIGQTWKAARTNPVDSLRYE